MWKKVRQYLLLFRANKNAPSQMSLYNFMRRSVFCGVPGFPNHRTLAFVTAVVTIKVLNSYQQIQKNGDIREGMM